MITGGPIVLPPEPAWDDGPSGGSVGGSPGVGTGIAAAGFSKMAEPSLNILDAASAGVISAILEIAIIARPPILQSIVS